MMDGKSSELTFEEKQDICTVLKYIPKILISYKNVWWRNPANTAYHTPRERHALAPVIRQTY